MYVSSRQINVKLPEDLADGTWPVQACFQTLCSLPRVIRISAHTAFLQVNEPVYIHMPIWIDVELPYPYKVSYPCGTNPFGFDIGGMDPRADPVKYKIEVRRGGEALRPRIRPEIDADGWELNTQRCGSGSHDPFRLPLHLVYEPDQPGVYSIRFTGVQGLRTVVQSAWIDVEVKTESPSVRAAWLRVLAAQAKSASVWQILREVVPSLLAQPDERALRILLPVYSIWLWQKRRLVNSDLYVAAFLRNSLAAFDNSLLRRAIPASTLAETCPPAGNCKDLLRGLIRSDMPPPMLQSKGPH
jgi:hypothetical protein